MAVTIDYSGKVVLVTGHEITNDDVVPAGATILRKPVDLDRLLEIAR